MPFHPDVHHRRSIRMRSYDYAAGGAYFITVCARERAPVFGEIADGAMRLNGAGRVVDECWRDTAIVRPYVTLDEFVVMPDHFHAIAFVGATRCVALPDATCPGATHRVESGGATHRVAPTGPAAGSIGAIVGQFKSVTTKRINAMRGSPGMPVWQRNYWERIIRDDAELDALRAYIRDNPRNRR